MIPYHVPNIVLLIANKLYPAIVPFTAKIGELIQLQLDVSTEIEEGAKTIYSNTRVTTIIFLIITLLLGSLIAVLIVINISKILRTINDEVSSLAKSAIDGKLSTRGDTEKIDPEFRSIVEGINNTYAAKSGLTYMIVNFLRE
jgi:methyl-accepting chemotaxis protein